MTICRYCHEEIVQHEESKIWYDTTEINPGHCLFSSKHEPEDPINICISEEVLQKLLDDRIPLREAIIILIQDELQKDPEYQKWLKKEEDLKSKSKGIIKN